MAGRTFVRGVTSADYGLSEFRNRQLAAGRVIPANVRIEDEDNPDHLGYTNSIDRSTIDGWTHISPGMSPFLTQTVMLHFVDFKPHGVFEGHGHQNEAGFYILEGSGYAIVDNVRQDWDKGDFILVHNDSVHQLFNPTDERGLAMVIKAKPLWMFLGLVQQGDMHVKFQDPSGEYGARLDWGQLWSDGVQDRKLAKKASEGRFELTPFGSVRLVCGGENDDLRFFSVDISEVQIPAGSRSGRRWQMADQIFHIKSGSGYSLHYRVEAEIDDKFYARMATEPTRYDFQAGDTVYVPQNTAVQLFASADEPLSLVSAQNRIYRHLGYDHTTYLEEAPEYSALRQSVAAPASVPV